MRIGARWGRRAALAPLAAVGLAVLIGCLQMGDPPISSAAQAAPAKPPAVSDGQNQAGSPAILGGIFSAPAANGIRNLGHVCNWDTQDWEDLTDAERKAFQVLGWSRETWDGDNENAASASGKPWSKLSPKERTAAQSLGYSAEDWDIVCPRDIPE